MERFPHNELVHNLFSVCMLWFVYCTSIKTKYTYVQYTFAVIKIDTEFLFVLNHISSSYYVFLKNRIYVIIKSYLITYSYIKLNNLKYFISLSIPNNFRCEWELKLARSMNLMTSCLEKG